MPRSQRRALGAYYTPPEIVQLILDLALEPALQGAAGAPLRVIDPACGAGEFLTAAAERIARRFGQATGLCGIDIDPAALAAARRRLPPECKTWQGDALNENAAGDGSFDVVLGNPPYQSIRQLAKRLPPAEIERLRRRFRTARGNFDLYVLFIERALALLRPGGRCGLIIPNKWATLDYARPCRELLLEHATIEHVVDLSAERVFAQASVYPHVLVFRKQRAPSHHTIRASFNPQPEAQGNGVSGVQQRSLSAKGFCFAEPLDVESRVGTQPLAGLATLSCGTAGYVAQRIARRLRNAAEGVPDSADFITSGNIDRYATRVGDVRYLGRKYQRPQLPLDAPELSPAKRRLFASPKIVIAGMSRRIEAAWDERGLALGVQVYAASELRVDPFYLLALLNSKLLSYLFATRFAAKRLAGGYLAINKGQLAKLPIPLEQASSVAQPGNKRGRLSYDRANKRGCLFYEADRLGELGRLLSGPARRPPHDDEADRLVYRLYQLSREEIERVEAHFAQPLHAASRPAA